MLLADLASAKRFIHMNYFIWGHDELTARITEVLHRAHRGRRRGADTQRSCRLLGVLEGRAQRAARCRRARGLRHQPARARELPQPPQDHRRRRGDRAQRRLQHRPGVHRRRQEVPGVARHRHPDHRARASPTSRSCSTCAGTRCSARTCSSPSTTRTARLPHGDDHGADGAPGLRRPVELGDARLPARRCRAPANDIMLQSPYFVPDQTTLDVLINAAAGGVRVDFMTTSMPDKKIAVVGCRVLLRAAAGRWRSHLAVGEGLLPRQDPDRRRRGLLDRHAQHGHAEPAHQQGAHGLGLRQDHRRDTPSSSS